jgi:hypothetical protein
VMKEGYLEKMSGYSRLSLSFPPSPRHPRLSLFLCTSVSLDCVASLLCNLPQSDTGTGSGSGRSTGSSLHQPLSISSPLRRYVFLSLSPLIPLYSGDISAHRALQAREPKGSLLLEGCLMGPYADPSDPSSKYAQATFTLFHPLRRTLILHAESPEKRYRVLLHLVVCAHSHSFFSLPLSLLHLQCLQGGVDAGPDSDDGRHRETPTTEAQCI